jgi:hypothetical protein
MLTAMGASLLLIPSLLFMFYHCFLDNLSVALNGGAGDVFSLLCVGNIVHDSLF